MQKENLYREVWYKDRPNRRCFERYAKSVGKLGLEVGGNKGSAICKAIGHPASPSSVLRTVKQIPLPPDTKTSGIIGVDDRAYKKGRNYGTIIVDLESRKVVDLLPDRESGTLARWLETHPEVHTVSRDRASAYSLGIRTGAPRAVQVADRFHLLVNIREAFQNSLRRRGRLLKDSFQAFSAEGGEPEGTLGNNQNEGPTSPEDENVGVFVGNVSPEKQFKFQKARNCIKRVTVSSPSPGSWGQAGKQSESISPLTVSKDGNRQNQGI